MGNKRRVAVIGTGCRYSGIKRLKDLEQILEAQRCEKTALDKRFEKMRQLYHPDREAAGKMYVREGFLLSEDPDRFDADFFGISDREAECMDYQQRVLLQVVQEALEDAGSLIRGSRTAVLVGGFMQDFLVNTMQEDNYDSLNGYHATGSSIGMLANRISYIYDLHGPSMAVDTACSSSLTALHLAVEGIRNKEFSTAICAGVNLITNPGNFITLCKGGFLSEKALCQAFGENADGYVRGEGAGVLILKDLEEAQKDRDRIYCEIAATAVNHDGKKKGLTYPNQQAQARLLQKIYGERKIPVDALGYLEAHGTGTQAGDFAETAALQAVFGSRTKKLIIGSVKSNIGHTEAAAGIASVLKGILTLRNKTIYKTLHCEKKNREIPWEYNQLETASETQPLEPAADGRYYVGVDGFGFGGSNAHIVLKDVPEKEEEGTLPERENGPFHFFLSANSKASLCALCRDYRYQIQAGSLQKFTTAEICACAARRRSHDHPWRLAVTAENNAQLAAGLSDFLNEQPNADVEMKCQPKRRRKTVAVFSGMGVAHEEMGRELYRTFPVFQETFERCSRAFEKAGGESLSGTIRAEGAAAEGEKELCKKGEAFWKIGFLQPYNLAFQIALYELIRSFGIQIDGCVGHSAGEMAAFYCSGFVSLEEIFKIAFHRGRAQQRLQGKGRMLAVSISRREAEALCERWYKRVSFAVENGKEEVVLSGEEEVLLQVREMLPEGTFSRFLNSDVAYHSFQMEEVREDFCRGLSPSPGKKSMTALYSTVYGERLDDRPQRYDATYWWKNMRQPVEFLKTLKVMRRDGCDGFVEIGAVPALMHYVAEAYGNGDHSYLCPLQKRESEAVSFCRGINRAYGMNLPIRFAAMYPKDRGMLPLPLYQWDEKRLPNRSVTDRYATWQEENELLGKKLNFPREIWEKRMNLVSCPWLLGHRVEKDCYLPGAAYVAMLSELGAGGLQDGKICAPVVVEGSRDTILNLERFPDGTVTASVTDASRRVWRTCFTAAVLKEPEEEKGQIPPFGKGGQLLEKEAVYRILSEKALHYSGIFCVIASARVGKEEVSADLIRKRESTKAVKAALLDSMLQAAALAGSRDAAFDQKAAWLPVEIGKVKIYGRIEEAVRTFARVTERGTEKMTADTWLADGAGNVLAVFEKAVFAVKKRDQGKEIPVYLTKWEELGSPLKKEAPAAQKEEQIALCASGDFYEDVSRLQKLAEENRDREAKLLVITRQAEKVVESDPAEGFGQAGLRGFAKCIPLEYPQLSLQLIDGQQEEASELLSKAAEYLKETELAVRNGIWYGMRIVKAGKGSKRQFLHTDTAVITGAAGGLAYHWALGLAALGCKNMALIARGSEKRTRLLADVLLYYGVQACSVSADVTDGEKIKKCFDQIRQKAPGELYVYHLAGWNKDSRSPDIDEALLRKHLAPKVVGAANLLRVMAERPENVCVAGSVTAILGNHGQGAYAAANRMLLSQAGASGCRYLGFGAMDTGMLAEQAAARQGFAAQGIEVMDAAGAVRAALDRTEQCSFIAGIDWRRVLKQRNALEDACFCQVRQEEEEENFLDQWQRQEYGAQRRMLEEFLCGVYALVLDTDQKQIGMERPLDTMGIHSLNATLAANHIRQTLETAITPEKAAGAFTIKELAAELHRELLSKNRNAGTEES